MQLATVLFLTSSLATMVMGATDIMECHKPALLSNCKKVCDCPGDAWNGNVRPDCSLPICHDNCLCHADPPPRYKSPTPPPPYAGKGKAKSHRRAPEPEPQPDPEPEPEAYEDGFEY